MSDEESFSSSVSVNGWSVWYEKFGSGPKPLLLIPGAIGRTDFYHQLEGDNVLDFDLVTIIAVELPGWGRSRPPVRKYGTGVYDNDAQCLYELMKELGFDKYSILSWSDGAKVALLMATLYPESIESVILTSVYTYISNESLKLLLSSQSVDNWHKDKLESYIKSYGKKEVIQQLWTKFIKFAEYYNQYFPESKNNYHLIKCRVLIVYGEKDKMCELSQITKLKKTIKRSIIYRFPNGEHNCHQKYSTIFKDVVEDYLMGRLKEEEDKDPNSGPNDGLEYMRYK
ncbi:unnamed protein product [Oppiella nova]|uniref:AB hydrolase-1 domain-containing protein n=1 Tax=Oppiella nova TaxID=334625 RepID=A0A7R9M801_9ACAR|nr:unnamed protein product [Oppiella nova]CAG2172511.1 unnamed protein product [Oppiella nova]